jgi:NADP-dependent 3-hydroxy acid dehydrogenase YdfG
VAVGPLALVADGRGVATRLAARLDRRGVDVVIVGEAEELDGTRGIVFLGGLDAVASPEDARAVLRDAFRCAKAGARDVAWVTVTALGGDFGASGRPERAESLLAGLGGLGRTLHLEHPAAFVRVLDLVDAADPDLLAAQIDAEIGQSGPLDVGVGPDGRVVLTTEPLAVPPVAAGEAPTLGPDDVVVVSGGARGVTAACVVALARASRARFVLLGRSRIDTAEPSALAQALDERALKAALFALEPALGPAGIGKRAAAILAAREARTTLAAVEAAGGTVRYEAVDVQDVDALDEVLSSVRLTWGPVTGLVHAAGVVHDKRIADKTLAQFDAVVDTKIRGMIALLEATQEDPLRVIVAFSSVAARTGNVGQSDYALANEALNRLAASEARRRPGCLVRSIGWGPWEGGMVTPALARQFAAQGIPLVPLAAGAAAFVAELAADAAPVECIIGGELAPAPTRDRTWRVSARSHPQLVDHALAGVPVVPAVLAALQLLAVARALRPAAGLDTIEDLRVLRGVPVQGFDDGGVVVQLHAEDLDGVVRVRATAPEAEAASGAARPYYQARVVCAPTPAPFPSLLDAGGGGGLPLRNASPEISGRDPWPRPVYGPSGDLFHGAAFQALQDVVHGDAGMSATILDPRSLGWANEDEGLVAALDAAVQLAALWTRRTLGGAALPTSIARLHLADTAAGTAQPGALRGRAAPAPSSSNWEARLVPVRITRSSTVVDVQLFRADGTVAAALEGVETYVLPRGAYPTSPPVSGRPDEPTLTTES